MTGVPLLVLVVYQGAGAVDALSSAPKRSYECWQDWRKRVSDMFTGCIAIASLCSAAVFMRIALKRDASLARRSTTYVLASVVAAGTFGILRSLLKRSARLQHSRAPTIQLSDGCLSCGGDDVSLVTLNALAPNLVSKQRYKYVPDGCLAWRFRFQRLCKLLKKVSPQSRQAMGCSRNK
jgi:hypothetical protein